MEEGLVLDLGQTGMVQEVAEHEATRLIRHAWHLFEASAVDVVIFTERLSFVHVVRFFQVLLISIFLVRNSVLSSLLIELALHEDVKEHGDCSTVSQLGINVHSPEEGMRVRILRIREAHQVDCDVTNHILVVKCAAY